MKPIGYSRRRTSRPSTDHHMVGACDLNGSQSRYSMDHIHHESNYFILLQHKSIYLDGEPHVVLTLLCRAQLHVEQIMLLHSLVAHSRRQSIMFHAGESYDGTALKSTVHCRPMERCRQLDDVSEAEFPKATGACAGSKGGDAATEHQETNLV